MQLKSDDCAVTVKTDADVTGWLPGDTVYDGVIALPGDLAAGRYMVRVALVHSQTGQPRLKLGNAGLADDGWYDLGEVKVVEPDHPVARYSEPGAP